MEFNHRQSGVIAFHHKVEKHSVGWMVREGKAAVIRMCDRAVQKDTLIGMQQCMAALDETLKAVGVQKLSLSIFTLFIETLWQQGLSFDRAVAYQAALLHWQISRQYHLSDGEIPWASRESNPTLEKIFKGYAYNGGNEKPRSVSSRGALGLEELQQVKQWVYMRNDEKRRPDLLLIPVLEVIIHAAIRRSEMEKARCLDYDEEMRVLKIVDRKSFNAKEAVKKKSMDSDKWIVSDIAHEFFVRRKRSALPMDFMFDAKRFKAELVADLIKRAGVALGWPEGLNWNSIHCARHGGDQMIIDTIARASSGQADEMKRSLKMKMPRAPDEIIDRAVQSSLTSMREIFLKAATNQSASTRHRYEMKNSKRLLFASEKRGE